MNEKQNTFRVLKDEVPLVSSIWCYLGFHNWTKWNDPVKGIHKNAFTMERRHALFQYRCCGNCGKMGQTHMKLGNADGY
jgi:hypothetical protein